MINAINRKALAILKPDYRRFVVGIDCRQRRLVCGEVAQALNERADFFAGLVH
jgi:hypothetical protein